MTLNKRLTKLEQKKDAIDNQLKGFDIVFVSCKEHVDHPERFRKVLESEEISEMGFKTRKYNLERIE